MEIVYTVRRSGKLKQIKRIPEENPLELIKCSVSWVEYDRGNELIVLFLYNNPWYWRPSRSQNTTNVPDKFSYSPNLIREENFPRLRQSSWLYVWRRLRQLSRLLQPTAANWFPGKLEGKLTITDYGALLGAVCWAVRMMTQRAESGIKARNKQRRNFFIWWRWLYLPNLYFYDTRIKINCFTIRISVNIRVLLIYFNS